VAIAKAFSVSLAMTKQIDNLKIAVLCGGVGSERAVSLLSGENICNALKRGRANAILHDINPEELSILDDKSIDVFFLALHGQFGEDGQLQSILEQKRLAFTGSGSSASRLSFDKIATKDVCRRAGLTVAKQIILNGTENVDALASQLKAMAPKVVVKPIRQGSSVGVEVHADSRQAAEAAMRCRTTYGDCMIEQFIAGREMTVGLLDGRALPVLEIRPKTKFYDYQAKYEDDATEYLFDTLSDAALVRRLQKDGETAFAALGCRHLGRVDFILTGDGTPYLLEMNTLPGFTSHSLLPMAAKKAGIAVEELCRQIAVAAWNDKIQLLRTIN
jgi:D-alanine-D-alanine ligase